MAKNARALFEPRKSLILAAAVSERIAICDCVMLITGSQARPKTVAEQGSLAVMLGPEVVSENVPGLRGGGRAAENGMQQFLCLIGGLGRLAQLIGILSDVPYRRVDPGLLRLNSRNGPVVDDPLER